MPSQITVDKFLCYTVQNIFTIPFHVILVFNGETPYISPGHDINKHVVHMSSCTSMLAKNLTRFTLT